MTGEERELQQALRMAAEDRRRREIEGPADHYAVARHMWLDIIRASERRNPRGRDPEKVVDEILRKAGIRPIPRPPITKPPSFFLPKDA